MDAKPELYSKKEHIGEVLIAVRAFCGPPGLKESLLASSQEGYRAPMSCTHKQPFGQAQCTSSSSPLIAHPP
jgi:hypothetical protein